MPRRALYHLRWSLEKQGYEIQIRHDSTPCRLLPESSAWFAWLEKISSLAFSSREGIHCTLLKERVQRGTYWYAYRTQQGRTRKRYVGRTADLSLARLEQISAFLANNSPASRMTRLQNTDQVNSLLPSISSPPPHLQESMAPLLFSKLQPPRLPALLIQRVRLFSLFETARSYKLILLQAPTGYGKTTAIRQWMGERYQSHPFPDAWVSLEAGDNDPARFWQSLIAACQNVRSDIGRVALTLLVSAWQPPFEQPRLEAVLTSLLNDLASLGENRLLILDDYHVITSPRIHETLTFFLEHLPPTLCLILLTRHEPPLPLMRWRVRGELAEIHTATLRFSLEETALFLRQTFPTTLSDETCKQLDKTLEGWPAGLRLLGLTQKSLSSQEIEQHLVILDESKNRSGLQNSLVDYLITEVLQAQPEARQHFLLQTSMLSHLTGTLCDHVTGGHNGAALLQEVERAGLFLEALDGPGHWYRYHALWASALRTEAVRRLGEETLWRLSQQASQWYEQHAMLREAIEMILHGPDVEQAATLIEQFSETETSSEPHALLRWLERIPEAVLRLHPALCFRAALAMRSIQAEGQVTVLGSIRAETALRIAEEGWQRAGNTARLGEVYALRALNAWQMKKISLGADAARQALSWLPMEQGEHREGTETGLRRDAQEWRCICQCVVGVEAMNEGYFDRARRMFLEALGHSSGPFRRVIILLLGGVLHGLGELHQASAYFHQVLIQGIEQEDWQDAMYALLNLARLSYEWNDLETCEQQLQEVLELEKRQRSPDLQDAVLFLSALVQAGRGQTRDALQQLTTLLAHLQVNPAPSPLPLLVDVTSWLFQHALATGDISAAQGYLASLTDHVQRLPPLYQEKVQILKARLLLGQGETQAVLQQLAPLRNHLQQEKRICEMIELQLLLALSALASSQKEKARQWLAQALSQARHEGFLRIFLDEGEPVVHLLREVLPMLQQKVLQDYTRVILRAGVRSGGKSSLTSISEKLLLEPLSPQEQRVLQKLCAGWTNAEIASALVISVNTVKDHVKHLYRKLGVRNRLDACEAARHLNLS